MKIGEKYLVTFLGKKYVAELVVFFPKSKKCRLKTKCGTILDNFNQNQLSKL